MIQKIAICLIWLSAIFDPVGSLFGFRYIALFVAFSVLSYNAFFHCNKISLKSTHTRFLIFFCFFIPIAGTAVGVFRGGFNSNSFIDTSQYAAAVYFLSTLIFVQRGKVEFSLRVFLLSTRILCFIIISFPLIDYFNLPVNYSLFFVQQGSAYLGERIYGGLSFYYVYFVASPMLVFLLAYESWSTLEHATFVRIIRLLIVAVAMFLSGTRFSMLIAISTIPLISLYKNRSAVPMVTVCFFALLTVVIFTGYYGSVISHMFSLSEGSTSIKLSYLSGYSSLFNDPLTLFFGQGFNAHEWSSEFSEMLSRGGSKTELTYLELIRVFGFFGALYFSFELLRFFLRSVKVLPKYRWVFPGIALYLFMSSLNPYIFSSNGMLVLGLAAAIVSLPSFQCDADARPKTGEHR